MTVTEGITHRWSLNTQAPFPDGAAAGLEPVVRRVLAARGLADPDELALFTDPRMSSLHDPDALPGCRAAAQRLLAAIEDRQRIVVYGDYDVDGVSAAAILFHTIRAIDPNARVTTYVPHRLEEGYGLHTQAVRALADSGAKLIISVDCGITAVEPARAARDAGVDLIITDHHNPGPPGQRPDAFAIVHPAIEPESGPPYPFPHLAGAGVAFKLAWRLATLHAGGHRVAPEMRERLLDMLALAAMATVADIVPLLGENRIITRFGLTRLPAARIEGLRALIHASDLDNERIGPQEVGFILGPRLNACGRLGHAREAVELLTTARGERAIEIARSLASLNEQRRATERRIFERASAHAEDAGMTTDRRAIVLAHEDWHPGVVGIVCSRLVGKYHRPAILMRRENGACQGSGRSIDGFNLHAALAECADTLTTFGGHDMAAGLSLDADRLDDFRERFLACADDRIAEDMLTPNLRVDCEASLDELTPAAVRQLLNLGPFGRDNPSPALLLRDVELARAPEPFGARGAHMSLFVKAAQREVRLVGWRWGQRLAQLRHTRRVSVVVEPKINAWRGRERLEPVIRDVAPATPAH